MNFLFYYFTEPALVQIDAKSEEVILQLQPDIREYQLDYSSNLLIL